VITHPSVAGAAVLAGLIVAGGSYAARHDVGLGSALPASADARMRLERELTAGYAGHHRRPHHLLAWHAPHVPKIHVRPPAPPVAVVTAAPAPVVVAAPAVAPTPVATSAPATTRTSPVGGDDGGGGDD
jgi:hypothetical protein